MYLCWKIYIFTKISSRSIHSLLSHVNKIQFPVIFLNTKLKMTCAKYNIQARKLEKKEQTFKGERLDGDEEYIVLLKIRPGV